MTPNSTEKPGSIFRDGKLKPGVYKIQNIQSETYLDIEVATREMCCRPAENLGEGRGLWEIRSLGGGYAVQRVEPGKPDQFCTSPGKLEDSPLAVAVYPVAWRVEVVDDDKHRGFEYVRFYWGSTNWAWSLMKGSKSDGTKVWPRINTSRQPHRIWRLIPVEVENTSAPLLSPSSSSSSPPSYDGAGGISSH